MSESTWDETPLVAIQGGKKEPPKVGEFESFAIRSLGERERRLVNGKRRLSFGVAFLDRCLGGIFPNDLILYGAKTGKGKTHLATLAAMSNAAAGRTVHYFALEAEQDEIERRVKFALLSEMIRAGCKAAGNYDRIDRMNYLDWYAGDLEEVTKPYEEPVSNALAKKYATLHTFYRTMDFYAENFETMVGQIQAKTDLIVLDHLHYVDSDEANENRGYKQMVKRIRDTALRSGKPVIVIAHLRKADRRGGSIVPDEEDFSGTKDIPNIATKIVLLAPCRDYDSGDPALWPTYIRPAKCRADGSRARHVGRVMFDAREGKYREDFDLGQLSPGEDKWELCDAKKTPRWAR